MPEYFGDDDYPALYGAANEYASASQRRFLRALAINLTLLVVASCLSIINVQQTWFAMLQALMLLISLALTIFLAAHKPQQFWYAARALAESTKTVAWRYMMRAEPFQGRDSEANDQLAKTLFKILEANKHVSSQATQILTTQQSTSKMQEIRALDIEERRKIYETHRVINQLHWYISKAQQNKNLASIFFCLLIAANSLAIFFALLRISYPSIEVWPTDVFVAASGALMAWLQTKRFQELAASYTLTYHEIGTMRLGLSHIDEETSLSKFVGDAENAFSREHTQWQARRDSI
jgi:hypothetical protein